MRRKLILPAVAASVALIVSAASTAGADRPATSEHTNDCADRNSRGGDLQVVGLVADGSLVCFRDRRPHRSTPIGNVTGLVQDASLVGIDYRPANTQLYGLGNAGGVYTIDVNTAQATLVSRLNQPLQGTSFGVDFNPTVDRLRVVSDTGQNLRVNVDDGTTTMDAALNIPGTPPVNPALGVTAVAYTNNDADPTTATTLFDIDTTNDNTVIQAPPNTGSLSATGKLGVDAVGAVGFDIYSQLGYGTTVDLRALASIATSDGATSLYRIDLLAGRAGKVGTFKVPVVDIAIPTAQR
jgi:Domain of unknown function (DUF4394)